MTTRSSHSSSKRRKQMGPIAKGIGIVVIAGVVYAVDYFKERKGSAKDGRGGAATAERGREPGWRGTPPGKRKKPRRRNRIQTGERVVDKAYAQKRSGIWLQASGRIVKMLPDDRNPDGGRHQKMLVQLKSGLTIRIVHNYDIAKKIPAREGDTIEFRGEYEYYEKGGTIHWTHHDPGGRHDGGWIKHKGVTYD